MSKRYALIAVLAATSLGCGKEPVAPSAVPSSSPAAAPDPTIGMTLLPQRDAPLPGQSFQLGVKFAIPDGWHIYWENPGDAGIATKVNVEVPEGFRVSSVQYPGPRRFVAAGDIVSYGWEGEAVMVAQIATPPAGITSPTTISVNARWLACKDSCVPGKASAVVTVPSTGDATPTLSDEQLARLPRPAVELGQTAANCVSEGVNHYQLVVPSAEEIEYFPEIATRVVTQEFIASGSRLKIALGAVPAQATPAGADGVLRVRSGDQTRFYDLEGFCPTRAGI